MNFTDRTTYISWAAYWKAAYCEHSIVLRKLKQAFKQAQRDNAWSSESKLRGEISAAKNKAAEMLEERHSSKVEAQRQYLAERAAKATA